MREELLRRIARKGHNVGYAANLNFATYDILRTVPGYVTGVSLIAGIMGLVWNFFNAKEVSAILLVLGIISLFVDKFSYDKDKYGQLGKKHTDQLNQLENLYYEVKQSDENTNFDEINSQLKQIESDFNNISQPKQIVFLSDWFAHYKLFFQKDVSWMDEQLHFGFWKDKIPESLKFVVVIGIIVMAVMYFTLL